MKTIYASLVKGSGLGKGLGSRLAALVVAVCFVSAIGSKALAQSASMTQLEFLQYMVQLSGESLGKSAKPADYALWARGKGMQPDAGWQLSAKLNRDVLAKSLVQYLGLNPRKGGADYAGILAREGIILPSSSDVKRQDFVAFVDTVTLPRSSSNGNGNKNGWDNGVGNPHNPDVEQPPRRNKPPGGKVVPICYGGTTKYVNEHAVGTFLARGATPGPCQVTGSQNP